MNVVKEQEILKLIRKITPNSKKYLHDDAAIIEKDLVVTTDSLIENTHFTLKTYTPEEIGWKALTVNLSDIAAMGAKPLYALISLTLPKKINLKWVKGLYKGINTCAKKYKTQIIGGNLAKGKEINITITVIGKAVRAGLAPARSNAKPGDVVFASGTFGKSKKKPISRIDIGQKIVGVCLKHAPALMDASDGLADCLMQIARESKVKIIVDENKIPISKDVKKILSKSPLDVALYGGEDYELVGTASYKDIKKIKGIRVIGEVVKGKDAFLKQRNSKLVKLDMKKTYGHFT